MFLRTNAKFEPGAVKRNLCSLHDLQDISSSGYYDGEKKLARSLHDLHDISSSGYYDGEKKLARSKGNIPKQRKITRN